MFLSLIKNLPIISLLPLAAALINLVGFKFQEKAAKIANLLIWLSFLLIFVIGSKSINHNSRLFIADNLTLTMGCLLLFISGIVNSYSLRYMDGDRKFNRYFTNLSFLTFFLLLLFCADNLGIILISWCFANFFSVRLMTHKSNWQQARNGARLAAGKLFFSSVFLILGLAILSKASAGDSISKILSGQVILFHNKNLVISLIFIMLAALIQSGCFLIKNWLLSSANTPTPILAIINAVLVNSGIFILIRLLPLYAKLPNILLMIFILGALAVLIGAWWTLVQNDIKHQLTCSTITQTGFVLMQYGLGLFYLAMDNLFTHAIFKATAFLASSSSLKEIKIGYLPSDNKEISAENIAYSFIFAALGGGILIIIAKINIFNLDAAIIPVIFAFMTAVQISLPFVSQFPIIGAALAILFSVIYAIIILAFKHILGSQAIDHHPLNLINILVIGVFIAAWLFTIKKNKFKNLGLSKFSYWLYVLALNTSRSNPASVTSTRKNYIY